jgi:hypothetical protein
VTPKRMLTARLPDPLISRLESFASDLGPETTRTQVVEAACRTLQFSCPMPDCDFRVPQPGPVCPVHGRRVVLP